VHPFGLLYGCPVMFAFCSIIVPRPLSPWNKVFLEQFHPNKISHFLYGSGTPLYGSGTPFAVLTKYIIGRKVTRRGSPLFTGVC